MSRSRIAVFEGYGAPLFNNPRMRGYGWSPERMPRGYGWSPERMPQGYGAPLFNNPRMQSYGRRPYRVSPLYESSSYGPVTESGRRAKALKRKGYKVKKGRNSAAQVRFKKAAKKCSRRRRGSFQQCMRKALKGKRRSKR